MLNEEAQKNYDPTIEQGIIDSILHAEKSETIIKIAHPIEIRIEGRPLSFQNKHKNKDNYGKFKETIFEKIDNYDYFITNRVLIEIELYIYEQTLYEDDKLPDLDNTAKGIIDILQEYPRGILIEDRQVTPRPDKKIIIPKPRISESEHFIIRILPVHEYEDLLFAIKKDEIRFIPIIKDTKSALPE